YVKFVSYLTMNLCGLNILLFNKTIGLIFTKYWYNPIIGESTVFFYFLVSFREEEICLVKKA
ncbi:MAG: hypothetical protein K8R85_15470, partial [Bacteroidetes bacterium]|nr:hypothetical protein [Bacteroidota bacterium]